MNNNLEITDKINESEIMIHITIKELQINRLMGENIEEMIFQEFSQVPTEESFDKTFNRLRQIALSEWYKSCGNIIKQILDSKAKV